MTIYTVKWTETTHHEIDVEADGPEEAREAFWLLYNSDDSMFVEEAQVDRDGPNDIQVRWFTGVVTK